jgi:hypothetical protein
MSWKFLDDSIPSECPPLPDDFRAGSEVIIRDIYGSYPGTVIAVGRVWVKVEANGSSGSGSGIVRRFRLDTQEDESNRGTPGYFRTPEQQRFFESQADAAKYLHTIGVRMEYGTPMLQGKVLELARLIHGSGLVPNVEP